MAMNIKSEEAHRLAAEIAAISGTTLTEAVLIALREQRARLDEGERRRAFRALRHRMAERLRGLPSDHDVLLYDPETGLPR